MGERIRMLTQLEEKGKVCGLRRPYMVILIPLVIIARAHILLLSKCLHSSQEVSRDPRMLDMLRMLLMIIFMSLFQEQCAQYWPQTKNSPEKMGSQLSVELISEGEFEDYICRELKITDLTVSTFAGHVFWLNHR